jgi:uncharacterized membrane protein
MVIPGWPMTRRRLLRHIDTPRIEKAIGDAEAQTSGEIRVSVVGFFRGDLRNLGERAFRRLDMHATQARNGVLILLAPTRRELVVLGDVGIQAHVGDSFWSALADDLGRRFKDRDFTRGLLDVIDRIGRELSTHFPQDPGRSVNELPDTVDVATDETRGDRQRR